MKRDLTRFLAESLLPVEVLVVESYQYLPALRSLLPKARIEAVTRQEFVPYARELQGLKVHWTLADYRREELPFAEESFDLLVAAEALTEAYEPYPELMALGRLLRDTGEMLTAFHNVRYHEMLRLLREGEFPLREQHFWAKPEVVRLLHDALFKEIVFLPGEQDEPAPEGENSTAEGEYHSLGFQNYQRDLATGTWLVRAGRSTASVANLKGMYSREVRVRLSRLLHRLEYGIDEAENLSELEALCRQEQIFPEYLEDFVQEACAHIEKVLKILKCAKILR